MAGAEHAPMDGFNPRAREGATIMDEKKITDLQSFNPRAREGATC